MAIANDIIVKLAADSSALVTGLNSAAGHVDAFSRKISGVAAIAKGAFATALGGVSARAIADFTAGAINSVAALDDLAEKTGATVESLSALSDIARIGGHDMGTVEASMIRLTKALAGGDDEAKGAGRALEALGLKAGDLRKLDTGAAMLEIAKALDKFSDSGGKSALIMDLLGKSGAQALPFLKDMAEKGELVAKVTGEQAAEAERLQKSWNQLKVFSDDLGRSLAGIVVPALNDVINNFNAARAAGFGFFQSFTGVGVRGLTESIDDAKNNAGARLNELRGELARLEKNKSFLSGRGLPTRDTDVAIADIERQMRYYKTLQGQALAERYSGAQYLDARDLAAQQRGSLSDYSPAGGGKGGKTKTQEIIDALGSGTYLTRDKATAAAIKESFDFENWAWGELAKDRETAAKEADRHAEANERANQALIAMTSGGKLNALIEQQDRAAQLLSEGRIDFEGYDEILDKLAGVNTGLKDAGEQMSRNKDISRELGMTFSSAFEDAIIGGKKFSDVLKAIGQDIARIFIRKNVTEPMANAISGFSWSKLLPSANGNIFSSPGLSAYSGQIVSQPTVFPFARGIGLMGEAGPEAILPLTRIGGRLGVQATAAAPVINIEVNNNAAQQVQAQVKQHQGPQGTTLQIQIDQIEAGIARNVARGRGALAGVLGGQFGLNRAAGAV